MDSHNNKHSNYIMFGLIKGKKFIDSIFTNNILNINYKTYLGGLTPKYLEKNVVILIKQMLF